jgi:hypothetical protein
LLIVLLLMLVEAFFLILSLSILFHLIFVFNFDPHSFYCYFFYHFLNFLFFNLILDYFLLFNFHARFDLRYFIAIYFILLFFDD